MARRISLITTAWTFSRKFYHSIAVDVGAPARAVNLRVPRVSVFWDGRPDHILGDKKIGGELLKGHFNYIGQSLDVGVQGDPWSIAAPSERFAEWLHGFHWMADLLSSRDKAAMVRARYLVDRWSELFGHWNAYAWNPDILTHRLYNWLALWAPALSVDSLSDLADTRRRVTVRQLKRLKRTFTRLPDGPIRLKAAATLAIGGLRLSGRDDPFYQKGLDLLDDEITRQILPDGGVVTRCPADIMELLSVLMTLDDLIQSRGVEGSSALTRAIDRMQPALTFFQHTDGRLASFNGSGEGNLSYIQTLLKKAKLPDQPFSICPNTAYQRVMAGDSVLIVDSGGTPDLGFDTKAHQAPLAFELSNEAGRMIVNCGWSSIQPPRWHRMMRHTASHSTLTLDDHPTGTLIKQGTSEDLYGSVFSQSVGNVQFSRREQTAGTWLEGSHDGYAKLYGLHHRRRFFINVDGKDIRGEDTLYVPLGETPETNKAIPFVLRFHLHPSVIVTLAQDQNSALIIQPGGVGWRLRTDSGPINIEKSVYLADGFRGRECQQIVIQGAAFGDGDGEAKSNCVRWSLRRLEKRVSR
ncbi:MAG: heparinase II/III family protein [Maricaulaceae bacterium]